MVGWLPRYDRRLLRGDIVAGIAVTALIVPKDLGYAGIAGVPLQNGLYAAAAGRDRVRACSARPGRSRPGRARAWRRSRAAPCSRRASKGEQAAQLVAAITLATGLLFLLLAVFKLGRIAQFLSKAVVTGFLAGAAIDVTIGELPS